MVAHCVLRALVRRATRCGRPFNCQDSLLIIKALHTLRYRSDEVKTLCEKCAFSIVSSRITIPVERAVDALSSLLSLQAAPLPIVHEKLAGRLMEVTQHTVSSRYAQKAAVVVMKLGKRYCRPSTADHIFDVLTQFVGLYPDDMALRLALISVYAYTSGAVSGESVAVSGLECETKAASRLSAVLDAAVHLVDANILHTLRGNSALQALHLFPIIAQGPVVCRTGSVAAKSSEFIGGNCGGGGGGNIAAKRDVDDITGRWDCVRKSFCENLQLATVVPGGYAQFLHDFLPSFTANNSSVLSMKINLLDIIQHETFFKALNSYDVAKIAMALSHTFAKRHAHKGKKIAEEQLQNKENSTTNSDNNSGKCMFNEVQTALRVLESLVRQLYFFHTIAGWSQEKNGGRVDQMAVGAVWHVTQRFVCGVTTELNEVKEIVTKLVKLTREIANKLPDVWSWVLYSMSMCARTAVYSVQLDDTMESVVQGSFFASPSPSLSLRSCVQALYAVSILMDFGVEGKNLQHITPTSTSVQEEVHGDANEMRWGPHHPLVLEIIRRLLQFCFRDYVEDDVPMLLQAFVNIMRASYLWGLQVPSGLHEMADRVSYYIHGNRRANWHCKHGVNMACSLLSMSVYYPDNNNKLNDALKQIFYQLELNRMIDLNVLCRLLGHVAMLKRGGFFPIWVCEYVLRHVSDGMSCISASSKTSLGVVLEVAELAHELGSTIVFVTKNDEATKTRRLTISLDLSSFVFDSRLTPVDAAQALRLMSYEIQSTGFVRVPAEYIATLRHVAIHSRSLNKMQIQTLLYLLRANANMRASRVLFDEKTLHAIVSAVCFHITKSGETLAQRGDMIKVVHAFISSQVLLRLGRSLQSYAALAAAVEDVLNTAEATKTEKPETLFQLRLLCGG